MRAPAGSASVRAEGESPSARRRAWGPLTLLTAALVVAVALSSMLGTRVLSPAELWEGLLSPGSGTAGTVIWQMRMPRTLLGLIVGVCLGTAGVLAQSLTRNPLADPGLLGISAGAAAAILTGSAVFGLGSATAQIGLSLFGAALAAAAVYAAAARAPGGPGPVNLTLAGAALTAFLGAVISALSLLDAKTMDQYRYWVVGSLSLPDPGILVPLLPLLALGLALAAASTGSLNALALGEDTAAALGVRVGRARLVVALAVTLLSGGAVALAGPVAFVGLVVPHMARAVVGADLRRLLPASALAGATLLVAADVVGRMIARPSEVQVGIVTALVGVPCFLWLIRRTKERTL